MRIFRKVFAVLLVLLCLLSLSARVFAEDGNVSYSGNAGKFIFAPGSEYSPTDLFPNFKDVMPGDSISQRILIKNDASNNVKIKVYMRSLGAQEGSEAFLSQLHLRVEKLTNTILFDAAADESAQLTEWVYLGTLYSGGEVELNVILDVPVTLDNVNKNLIGYLDWQFMVEEFPIESTDPEPPKTGDDSNIGLYGLAMAGSAFLMIFLLLPRRKKEAQN